MKIFFLLSIVLLSIYNLQAQGCSDAGVCSIGGLKGQNGAEKGYFALNLQYGVGEQNVKIFTPQLEGVFKIGNKSGLQFKLPYIFVSGNLGAANGLGDITAVFTHRYYDKDKWKLGVNGGVKVGVNAADKKSKKSSESINSGPYSFPMPYQTSLGTHDILLGLDAKYNDKWVFGLGFQMPVYQFNANGFDAVLFDSTQTKQKEYFTSAQLFRRPDLVIRVDRYFKIHKKISANAGVLPIYHLGHDRYTDTAGISQTLSGSKGLTLNVNAGLIFEVKKYFTVIFRYASPVIVRKVRPDGLTRHYVTGLELRYSF